MTPSSMEPEALVDLLISPEREHCNELALVLASQAIASVVRFNGRSWALAVASGDVSAARRELDAYVAESRRPAVPAPRPLPPGNLWPGVGIYVGLLMAMALLAAELGFGFDWLAAGSMDGRALRSGDWWRPITALLLHADAPHLLGNAFFGSFFGYSVARYLGSGFGWLLILGGGALGNLANGWLSGPAHRSIGASTAVFAALGLLSAYCWRQGFPAAASRRERFAPVVAGIGLLAFTGTGGENTDLGAHLLGFVAGFATGLVVARLGYPTAPRAQLACGLAAAVIVAAAWLAALA